MSNLKKYKFLFKPAFFIFNILFSTWLVIKIEQISPSDFGRYKYWFEARPKVPDLARKNRIQKLCNDYKAGLLDSTQLESKILNLIEDPN
jgi:hypothetical protein